MSNEKTNADGCCNCIHFRYLLEELEEATPNSTPPTMITTTTTSTLKRKLTEDGPELADEEYAPAAEKPKPAKAQKMAANKKTKAKIRK